MRVPVFGLVIIMKTLDSWRPGVVRISLLSPPPHGKEQAGAMMVWPGASCRGGWCQDCAIKINVSSAGDWRLDPCPGAANTSVCQKGCRQENKWLE